MLTFPAAARTRLTTWALVLVTAASALLVADGDAAPADAAGGSRVVGSDISWPECPHTMGIPGKHGEDKPMPPVSSEFVVAGLTNGPAFSSNPCLRREVAWIENHHVYAAAYAVTTYPLPRQLARYGGSGPYSSRTLLGRLRNVGYHQAGYDLATLRASGLRTPAVWIDVEPSSLAAWPHTPVRNRAVVEGVMRGYRHGGYRIGFYSTPYLWQHIMGRARYRVPEWRTAGQTSLSAALSQCSTSSFQGGRAVLGQWWTPRKDYDVVCGGFDRARAIRRWFHKY